MIHAERRQFLGILAHAITVHKSQGNTFEYMMGDMYRTSDKITSKGKPRHVNVQPGQFNMMLSRGKSKDRVSLSNFNEDQIKVNLSALEEMYRMRDSALFSWNHPLQIISRCICFHNIRS